MGHDPFVIGIAVAIAVLASAGLARVTSTPYPVFLVLAGLLASLVPGMPTPKLDPDVVFYVFLPPLIYYAGFLTSPREMRSQWRRISILALGLVLVTVFAVAVVARYAVPEIGWASAFVLGAIVAPTDPIAATAVLSRLGAPRRLTTVLESESLLNDGIALTIYGVAVTAASQGHFSPLQGLGEFAKNVAGGVAWGLLVAVIVAQARKRISDSNLEITLSLVTPFVAYIPADRMGLSGVLATVTCGLYLGSQTTGIFHPGARLQARAFWDQLDFLLNSVLFVLLGLQFADIVGQAGSPSPTQLVVYAVVVSVVVIASRLAFEFAVPPIVWHGRGAGQEPWRHRLLMGWGGIRGALSLAAALSVPYTVSGGGPFPARGLILFLTFTVILATLVVQGTTLPGLIRLLGLGGAGHGGERERETRLAMIDAALRRADELGETDEVPPEVAAQMRERFERQRRMLHSAEEEQEERDESRVSLAEWRRLQRSLIAAQRGELNRRYRQGLIDAEQVRRIRRELDLEESLLS